MGSLAYGALNKTYPTAATTNLRIETYVDGISTMYNSTYTVKGSTWVVFGSTWVYIPNNQIIRGTEWHLSKSTTPINPANGVKIQPLNGLIYGYRWAIEGSSYTVKNATWTIEEYSKLLIDQAKNEFINEIVEKDISIYMVEPSSYCTPGNIGWAVKIINGNRVYFSCQ